MDEKNQADHVSAHLIEVVVAHLRKKNGADVANGPSAAMNAQQVLILFIFFMYFRHKSYILMIVRIEIIILDIFQTGRCGPHG